MGKWYLREAAYGLLYAAIVVSISSMPSDFLAVRAKRRLARPSDSPRTLSIMRGPLPKAFHGAPWLGLGILANGCGIENGSTVSPIAFGVVLRPFTVDDVPGADAQDGPVTARATWSGTVADRTEPDGSLSAPDCDDAVVSLPPAAMADLRRLAAQQAAAKRATETRQGRS